MNLEHAMSTAKEFRIQQRKELAEFFGFETRNKYEIHDASGAVVGFAAEQGKGVLAHLSRYFMGHWRRFEMHVYDSNRKEVWTFTHPFRWFFQRLEVRTAGGTSLGALQQRWGVFHKRFQIEGPNGNVLFTMNAPFWKIWTFPIEKQGNQIALIEKKWSGFIKELITDADNFRVSFSSPTLKAEERVLILAAAFFIDLQYFEKKAKNN